MFKPIIEYMPLHIDDRGSVYCVKDNLSAPFLEEAAMAIPPIKRTYIVQNWEKGRVRAWHGHRDGWTGMHVIRGAAKVVARPFYDGAKGGELVSATLSERRPGILWVPPLYWNGAVTLEDDTRILVYSTLTFEQVKQDDPRAPLHDHDIEKYFKVVNR